jgi:hypoxanthine phosphoribosyltransferase
LAALTLAVCVVCNKKRSYSIAGLGDLFVQTLQSRQPATKTWLRRRFTCDEETLKTVLSADEIQQGVARLAEKIREHYGQKPLTILAIMTGSVVLLADLIRRLDMPLRVGVMQASSYRGANTTRGELLINMEMTPDIHDRDVLLVDDIFDTGHTLEKTIAKMWSLKPQSIRSAVLLRKQGRQEVSYVPDFVAFEIPDEFVVGYGLDYQDEYRNLPYLAALEPSDLAATA